MGRASPGYNMTFALGTWLILCGPWFCNKTHIALYCWNITVSSSLYYHRRNRSHRSGNSRTALKSPRTGTLNAQRLSVNTGIKCKVNTDINKAQNNCIKNVLFALITSWHIVSRKRSLILCLSQLNLHRSSNHVPAVLNSVLNCFLHVFTTNGWPFIVGQNSYMLSNMNLVQFQ
jgi:hypothetical protein